MLWQRIFLSVSLKSKQKVPAFVRKPEFFVLFRTFFYILLFLLDFFHIAPEGVRLMPS